MVEALLFILALALPPVGFGIYAAVVRRWSFRKLTPYMVGYVFVLSGFLSALLLWAGELTPLIAAGVVAISTFGTWAVWRAYAGALEAIEELRKQRGIK